jgi:hypothetical protein
MINADLTKLSEAAFSQENETIKTKIRSLLVNLSMPKTSSPPSLVSYFKLFNPVKTLVASLIDLS